MRIMEFFYINRFIDELNNQIKIKLEDGKEN